MPNKIHSLTNRARLWWIRMNFSTHSRVIVPNSPHVWQDMENGHFYVGVESEFVRIVKPQYKDEPEKIIGVAHYSHCVDLVLAAMAPYRHYHLGHLARAIGLQGMSTDQGFLTSHGRYVRRVEALEIAKARNQLIRKTGCDSHLFSEDVWDIPEELNINKPKEAP